MKVLYPGTFDPFTYGHGSILSEIGKVFGPDNIVVGVHCNPAKKPLFTVEERVYLIAQHYTTIEVVAYEGLTVDFCKNMGIHTIVRGVRNQTDFEYEYAMSTANAALAPNIKTVIMMVQPKFLHISSSMVKDIVRNRGDIGRFVSGPVAEALEDKLLYE